MGTSRSVTPGSELASLLKHEPGVTAVHQDVLADGTYSLTVALRHPDRALTYRVFTAEDRIKQQFPKARIDVRVTATMSIEEMHMLASATRVRMDVH